MKFFILVLSSLLLSGCINNVTKVNVPLKECKYVEHFKTAHQGGVHTYVQYQCNIIVSVSTDKFNEEESKKLTDLTNLSYVY